MRSLPKPLSCRSSEIAATTQQVDLRSFPHLIRFGLRVARSAGHYDANHGDPLRIRIFQVSKAVKDELHYLYGNPPKKLSFISDMREGLAGETCPMCGGQDPVSLDHFLPKATYAEYSLLSFNLVPACACNLKKGKVVADFAQSRRLLHPYYDACLALPLYVCDFDPTVAAPVFAFRVLLSPSDPDYGNVQFHLDNVVLRTHVRTFLSKRWQKLKQFPDDILWENRAHRGDQASFRSYLDRLTQSKARIEGENAWETVFYRSIAVPAVADWMLANT